MRDGPTQVSCGIDGTRRLEVWRPEWTVRVWTSERRMAFFEGGLFEFPKEVAWERKERRKSVVVRKQCMLDGLFCSRFFQLVFV